MLEIKNLSYRVETEGSTLDILKDISLTIDDNSYMSLDSVSLIHLGTGLFLNHCFQL